METLEGYLKKYDWTASDGKPSEGMFVVTHVSREDIAKQFDVSEDKLKGVSDEEMRQIAEKMTDCLCDGCGYWEALEAACEKIIGGLVEKLEKRT